MPETVTRLRPTTTTDGYGDTVTDWSSPTSLTLTPYGVEPVSSSEDNDGRQAVITGFRLYWINEWPDVAPTDRMTVRGTTWEVDGEPADWQPPGGLTLGGLVVALKAVTG